MAEETRSLWEQLDSEVEPWRRGRVVLVVIGAANFLLQTVALAAGIILGDIEGLLAFASTFVLFWLLFYFIWIGVHWIRWIAGAWSGLAGFACLIWGWRDSNGYAVVFGCVNLVVGSYFCLSSSVYFFAKRQQERRSWTHSLLMAAVFALLSLTFFIGSVGLLGYKRQVQEDACHFADDAFAHIFSEHDTYFFLDHMTERALAESGGRARATKFLQGATLQAGDVHDIQRATGNLKVNYRFATNLRCAGIITTEGVGAKGPVLLRLDIVQVGQGWLIESVSWHYHGSYR